MLPIWLVLAGYSAWHFFTDGVFQIKNPWTGRLLRQLSLLLQNILTLHMAQVIISGCHYGVTLGTTERVK